MKTLNKALIAIIPIVLSVPVAVVIGISVTDKAEASHFLQSEYDRFSLKTFLDLQFNNKDDDNCNYVYKDYCVKKHDDELLVHTLLSNAEATIGETKYGKKRKGYKSADEKYGGFFSGYGGMCLSISLDYRSLELRYSPKHPPFSMIQDDYFKYYAIDESVGIEYVRSINVLLS